MWQPQAFFVSLARRLSTPCCCRKLCNVTPRRTARCTMPSRGGRRAVTRGPRSQPRTAAVAAELMPPSMPRRRCWRVAAGGRPRSLSVARHGRSRRCARAAVSAAPGHATQHAVRCGRGAVAGASAQCAPRHPDSGYPVPRGHSAWLGTLGRGFPGLGMLRGADRDGAYQAEPLLGVDAASQRISRQRPSDGVICFGPPAVQEWSHDAARRVGVWPVSCVRSSLRGPQVSLHTAHFSPETAHRP